MAARTQTYTKHNARSVAFALAACVQHAAPPTRLQMCIQMQWLTLSKIRVRAGLRKNSVVKTGPNQLAVAVELQAHGSSCASLCRLVCLKAAVASSHGSSFAS